MKAIRAELKINNKVKTEWRLLTPNGEVVDTELSAFIIEALDKEYLIIIYKNISDQKQNQLLIQQQVHDLNRKNEELQRYIESNMQLENFAYLASHDLKAPIRNIVSLTQMLEMSAL